MDRSRRVKGRWPHVAVMQASPWCSLMVWMSSFCKPAPWLRRRQVESHVGDRGYNKRTTPAATYAACLAFEEVFETKSSLVCLISSPYAESVGFLCSHWPCAYCETTRG